MFCLGSSWDKVLLKLALGTDCRLIMLCISRVVRSGVVDCCAQVISGHQGWVRCVDVEPANQWFVTGSADRIIKVRYYLSHVVVFLYHCV